MALVYILLEDFAKAEEEYLESVRKLEEHIFSFINKINEKYLKKDEDFMQKLQILIYTYVYIANLNKKIANRAD